jgi:uncharacterized protein YaaN involved in tellurite resistance
MSIDVNNKENTSNGIKSDLVPAIVEVKPAKRPDELTDQQVKDINDHADKAITALMQVKGDIFADETNQIINIGVQDQKAIGSNLALMQEKMGDVFYSKEKSSVTNDLSKDITELQDKLAKINPKDIQKQNSYRLIAWIPFFGNRIIYALKQSVNKGMTLQQFVEHLSESLVVGERMLREDNAQLKVINDGLHEKQNVIKADAYFAEVLMGKLSDVVKASQDEQVKKNLNEVLFKVGTRAQDLRAMENVHEQFFISLKMTRNNNDLLIDGARRMQTMGMTVVYTAMELNSALIRSKKVREVEQGTGEFIGKMLVSNSQLIHQSVLEIGDMYKNPFIPMKMMEDSATELEKAIDDWNKLKMEGIEAAKENIGKIKVWTEEIKKKAGELPDMEVKSLEASKTLMLGQGK